jgi:hypothetical protein
VSERGSMGVIAGLPYQAHQVECGTPQETVWIAERLRQFEMVVVLAYQEPHLLADSFDCGGEFAVLALVLGGFTGAVGDDQRRCDAATKAASPRCRYGSARNTAYLGGSSRL